MSVKITDHSETKVCSSVYSIITSSNDLKKKKKKNRLKSIKEIDHPSNPNIE